MSPSPDTTKISKTAPTPVQNANARRNEYVILLYRRATSLAMKNDSFARRAPHLEGGDLAECHKNSRGERQKDAPRG
jgi:hypothetical protein